MPIVFRYKNFRFFFYSNEGNPREAMHIHVRNPQGEAKFWMTPYICLAAAKGLMLARCASCKMRSLPTVN